MGLFISIIKIIEQLYNISSYGAFLGVTYCIRSHTQFLYTKGGHVSYSSMLQVALFLPLRVHLQDCNTINLPPDTRNEE